MRAGAKRQTAKGNGGGEERTTRARASKQWGNNNQGAPGKPQARQRGEEQGQARRHSGDNDYQNERQGTTSGEYRKNKRWGPCKTTMMMPEVGGYESVPSGVKHPRQSAAKRQRGMEKKAQQIVGLGGGIDGVVLVWCRNNKPEYQEFGVLPDKWNEMLVKMHPEN